MPTDMSRQQLLLTPSAPKSTLKPAPRPKKHIPMKAPTPAQRLQFSHPTMPAQRPGKPFNMPQDYKPITGTFNNNYVK